MTSQATSAILIGPPIVHSIGDISALLVPLAAEGALKGVPPAGFAELVSVMAPAPTEETEAALVPTPVAAQDQRQLPSEALHDSDAESSAFQTDTGAEILVTSDQAWGPIQALFNLTAQADLRTDFPSGSLVQGSAGLAGSRVGPALTPELPDTADADQATDPQRARPPQGPAAGADGKRADVFRPDILDADGVIVPPRTAVQPEAGDEWPTERAGTAGLAGIEGPKAQEGAGPPHRTTLPEGQPLPFLPGSPDSAGSGTQKQELVPQERTSPGQGKVVRETAPLPAPGQANQPNSWRAPPVVYAESSRPVTSPTSTDSQAIPILDTMLDPILGTTLPALLVLPEDKLAERPFIHPVLQVQSEMPSGQNRPLPPYAGATLLTPVNQGFTEIVEKPEVSGIDTRLTALDTLPANGVWNLGSPNLPTRIDAKGVDAPFVAPLVTQISESLVSQADGSTTLSLTPEELGEVRLTFHPDQKNPERLVVLLGFERLETHDLFRRHADQLAEALRNAGFAGVQIGFGGPGAGHARPDPKGSIAAPDEGGSAASLDDVQLAASRPTMAGPGALDLRL